MFKKRNVVKNGTCRFKSSLLAEDPISTTKLEDQVATESRNDSNGLQNEVKPPVFKRRRVAGVRTASAKEKPEAETDETCNQHTTLNISTTLSENNEAVKHDRLFEEDEQASLEKSKQAEGTTEDNDNNPEIDGIYRGSRHQTIAKFITKDEHSRVNKFGPMKAASNIRSTMVTDYQPDVCKDYKQTGYCGYGDTCKFLHLREDYKAGWQLDREWEINNQKESETSQQSKVEEKDGGVPEALKDVPFKCLICKEDYKEPIKTKCGHHFCESCFLTKTRKSTTCPVCGKNTEGIALPAKELRKFLKERKQSA